MGKNPLEAKLHFQKWVKVITLNTHWPLPNEELTKVLLQYSFLHLRDRHGNQKRLLITRLAGFVRIAQLTIAW